VFDAILADHAHDLTITDFTFSYSTPANQHGIVVSASSRVRLERLSIAPVPSGGEGYAAVFASGCPDLSLVESDVAGGILLVSSPGAVISDNASARMRVDLEDSPGSVVSGNRLTSSTRVVAVLGASDDTRVNDNILLPATPTDPGVLAESAQRVSISRNVIGGALIELTLGANGALAAPTDLSPARDRVSGRSTAPDGSVVAMRTLVGEAPLTAGGFALSGLSLAGGEWIVATVTDPAGNTSRASAAAQVP
jgi:hypothetical protein